VTDEVIDYRAWIRETFPLPSYTSAVTNQDEDDSLSSSSSSEASTLESGAGSDTVRVSGQFLCHVVPQARFVLL